MKKQNKPHFIIKNNFQKNKSISYRDILTPNILEDVCERVTGCREYTCEFDNNGYNKGRLAIIIYRGTTTYVSFSETNVTGRNYFFQSLTTALVRYCLDDNPSKNICFYFLPLSGSVEARYFMFMYRLMATAMVNFLNADKILNQKIYPFSTVDDIIAARDMNKNRNRSNNSTYITRSSKGITQIYGKTYGASKKETTLLCIAVSCLAPSIELYEICEKNLSELPELDLEVIKSLGNVKVIQTDLTMERKAFEENNSLRSPSFIYNLLEIHGAKKCAFCECEIPELIEGAHIWPVAEIKRESKLDIESKIKCATDGNNGIWLCENHHKLLDEDLLTINLSGKVEYKSDLEEKHKKYIFVTTSTTELAPSVFTAPFITYLKRRLRCAS